VRVAGTGGGALLDEHGKEGVEAAKQWVSAVGGQAGDDAGAGGARQNQLVPLRRAVHWLAKSRPRPRPIPTAVPHQVGHVYRRRRVSSVSGVSDLCFKRFI
jgi:hypothetical protein